MVNTSVLLLLAMNIGRNDQAFCARFQSNMSAVNSCTLVEYSKKETTVLTTQFKARIGSNTCERHCTSPPQISEGIECVLESQSSTASYSALKRENIDTFDHCPVSVCSSRNIWSSYNISLSSKECYTVNKNGEAVYDGKNTCTVTGRKCQRWDQDNPHKRYKDNIPKNQADLHSNYCRDPGPPYSAQPWCYTTDKKVRWEYCYIPKC